MKLRSLLSMIALIIILGVIVAILANLYFSRHPILISDGENICWISHIKLGT